MTALDRYRLIDPVPVVVESLRADMQLEVWELRKDHVVQIIALEREAHRIVKCHVNELTLLFIYHVMIADQLLTALRLTHLVWLVGYAAGDQGVSNSNKSLLNEVHLVDLLIFIVNDLIEDVVLKATRLESLGDLEQQANVLLLVERALGVVKEPPEGLDDVLEQVLDSDVDLHFVWHAVKAEVVVIEKLISVI
jgi:hypothetical protein